jgi:hypothetical protein
MDSFPWLLHHRSIEGYEIQSKLIQKLFYQEIKSFQLSRFTRLKRIHRHGIVDLALDPIENKLYVRAIGTFKLDISLVTRVRYLTRREISSPFIVYCQELEMVP